MPRQTRERGGRERQRATAAAEEAPVMVTTTIALDEDTHRRLRHLAVEERTSFRELIREAITDLLTRRGRR